ncbi:hypothetical protein [Paraburkholderia azotifigens]|uniref:Uncharacterized protein n=1 Tax=Paraburkholderia azotifigens TaxID=2057004 RepID=A0ABU9R799_9BURK|nr:hypothetical protein [Paraburkholderia azotifigens]
MSGEVNGEISGPPFCRYWLAPEGAALVVDPGVFATGATLEGDGATAPDALSLALCAAALLPGVPLMPAVLLITPLLPDSMVLLLLSSTFLQAAAPTASAIAINAADTSRVTGFIVEALR